MISLLEKHYLLNPKHVFIVFAYASGMLCLASPWLPRETYHLAYYYFS